MKRALIHLCVFVSLLPIAHVRAEVQQSVPDWVRGTLFVSMLGAENPDPGNAFALRRYACLYNFEQGSLTTLQIPRDARLTRDLGGYHQPVLISHATLRDFEAGDWENGGRWKSFSVASYTDDPSSKYAGSFFYGVSEAPTYTQDGVQYFSSYDQGMPFDAPVQVLEIRSPEYCVYSLEYGVSEHSELEIRFIREKAQEKTIYERYPVDYPWGKWAYAVSPNGNVAYLDADTRIAVIVDDQQLCLPETEHTCGMAWRNDRELLLFAYTDLQEDKCYLRSYDVEQKRLKNVLDDAGAPIFIEDAFLCDMDVQPELDCLAYACIAHPNADLEVRIELISLTDQMRYGWNPYPLEAAYLEAETDVLTGEAMTATRRYAYTVSDDGIYLFEPSEETNLELTWYAGQR